MTRKEVLLCAFLGAIAGSVLAWLVFFMVI